MKSPTVITAQDEITRMKSPKWDEITEDEITEMG